MSEEKKKIQLPSQEEPEKKETIQPDPAILEMSRDEAMEYFKLPAWASREDLDKQFWKLGKIYRSQKDEQKLADIAAAYNIATGERDRKQEEKQEEETSQHILGKTKKQWGEFWHYEWWKFVLGAAVLVFLVTFIRYYFLAPKTDFRLASVGHFSQDTNILNDFLTETAKLKNPDVDYADMASGQTDDTSVDAYAAEKAVSLIQVRPDILVFDAMTAPVYVNGGNMLNLDDVYAQMQATWTEEQLSHFTPYIYSKAKFYEEYAGELPEEYQEELDALTEEDYVEHVYGFVIADPIDQLSLGYKMEWETGDTSIIFGINVGGGQQDKAKEVMLTILEHVSELRASYMETHPYAADTD
ncbi:MAG: hypothetical protein J5379_07385 [Clostridiales bacterium]|nr:hypothetical protein [Clostridiales bacterium]